MIVKLIVIKENTNKTISIDVTERSLGSETKVEKKIIQSIDNFLKNKLEVDNDD